MDNLDFSEMLNEVVNIFSQMRPDARQQIVDKMQEETENHLLYGTELKPFEQIINEVRSNMPDGKLFDDEDTFPFVTINGIEMCLN